MMPRRANPWSHKIDYTKAIAEDEREIALYESPGVRCFSETLTIVETVRHEQSVYCNAYHLLVCSNSYRVDRLRALGLTEVDLACAAFYNGDDYPLDLGCRCVSGGSDFRRGKEVSDKLSEIPVLTEKTRKRLLKLSKASLARHKRNQAKYGDL